MNPLVYGIVKKKEEARASVCVTMYLLASLYGNESCVGSGTCKEICVR